MRVTQQRFRDRLYRLKVLGALMDVRIEHADHGDQPAIFELLETSQLPTAGLELHLETALVVREQGEIIGCSALEMYGKYALLRSVAVAPAARGGGLGKQLVEAALNLARERGAVSVYLLTETAGAFFTRFGFHPVARSAIPGIVQTSVEFTCACPISALAMVGRLQEA
jgi:amino-acid N-acetyltransferase